jgi:hypothetical protein
VPLDGRIELVQERIDISAVVRINRPFEDLDVLN